MTAEKRDPGYPYGEFDARQWADEGPVGIATSQITVNGHMYVHVAACPCPEIQAENDRLANPATPEPEQDR